MATSDIPLEQVQALLKVDTGNGSLYEHIVRLVRTLAADKPADCWAQLEKLSRDVKLGTYRGTPAADGCHDIVVDAEAEKKLRQWCIDAMRVARPPSDPTAAPQVLGMVQNFMEDAAMFEWAGVGFGKQESYQVAMSLRKLAADTDCQRLRLWGKMLGTGGDYYVAEGKFPAPPPPPPPKDDEEPKLIIPGSPEDDVEPRGQGANAFTYWVSAGGAAPWVRLPSARASHIKEARKIQRLLTGDLGSPVLSTPWFSGKERHFLRAQIARIAATCTLAVSGYFEPDGAEEDQPRNPMDQGGNPKIKVIEGLEENFNPAPADLETGATWLHAAPYLLANGKSTRPEEDELQKLVDNGSITEQEKQALSNIDEPKEILGTIDEDLKEHQLEGAEGSPAWQIKNYGDKGKYGEKSYRVTAVRSLVWPGAITVAQGTKFANMYVGYGLKCGTLVPPVQEDGERKGMPLRDTAPFQPLMPGDVMDEPADEKEKDEPNPQQDEDASEGEDMDKEEGEE